MRTWLTWAVNWKEQAAELPLLEMILPRRDEINEHLRDDGSGVNIRALWEDSHGKGDHDTQLGPCIRCTVIQKDILSTRNTQKTAMRSITLFETQLLQNIIAKLSYLNVTPAFKKHSFTYNPHLFMCLVLKRTMSSIDINAETMWFALKVGEPNKRPLNWLLMWKHRWGPHQNKPIITPLMSHPRAVTMPVRCLAKGQPLPRRALVSLPVPRYVSSNWAFCP